MTRCIPVVDVFAGCGGLSEGFAQHTDSDVSYDIVLGLDSDPFAHETHLLRSFFHQFSSGKAPEQYYSVLRGEIGTDELYNSFPDESTAATNRIKHWELGGEGHPDENLHSLIEEAVDTRENWVLIGGPPCQAYSTAGRSRNNGKINYEAAKDHRNFLYREYLKILREHRPPVFLLENVPGLLSSKIDGRHTWQLMLEDLMDPSVTESEVAEPSIDGRLDGYRIYSLVTPDRGLDIFGVPMLDRDEFVVNCEEYGIPQSRHRVFLLGVRADIDIQPELLRPAGKKINAGGLFNGLPRLRSGLSRESDLDDSWIAAVKDALDADWWDEFEDSLGIRDEISKQLKRVRKPRSGRGSSFVPRKQIRKPKSLANWYVDERLRGICNHETRAHMKSDLHRYLFAACHARVSKGAIRLSHFPDGLLPDHKNVQGLPNNKLSHSNFADRFAVLLNDKPAHTVVSHIAKDGHYYIHPDPTQCRSLTVREAARLQTFPDNYYFMGNRSEQYRQVGNAVPPLLSIQIAGIVSDLLTRARSGD